MLCSSGPARLRGFFAQCFNYEPRHVANVKHSDSCKVCAHMSIPRLLQLRGALLSFRADLKGISWQQRGHQMPDALQLLLTNVLPPTKPPRRKQLEGGPLEHDQVGTSQKMTGHKLGRGDNPRKTTVITIHGTVATACASREHAKPRNATVWLQPPGRARQMCDVNPVSASSKPSAQLREPPTQVSQRHEAAMIRQALKHHSFRRGFGGSRRSLPSECPGSCTQGVSWHFLGQAVQGLHGPSEMLVQHVSPVTAGPEVKEGQLAALLPCSTGSEGSQIQTQYSAGCLHPLEPLEQFLQCEHKHEEDVKRAPI